MGNCILTKRAKVHILIKMLSFQNAFLHTSSKLPAFASGKSCLTLIAEWPGLSLLKACKAAELPPEKEQWSLPHWLSFLPTKDVSLARKTAWQQRDVATCVSTAQSKGTHGISSVWCHQESQCLLQEQKSAFAYLRHASMWVWPMEFKNKQRFTNHNSKRNWNERTQTLWENH